MGRTGYSALVSELMLQQTQVSRVVDAFRRFMDRYPTVRSLADAAEPEVLAAWQGLGYYRRARLLQQAARAVRDLHGGEVPRDARTLESLPGIGRYTAGAIASIVHDERVPIVDGNVLRVLSRLADHPTTAGDPADERWAWRESGRLVDAAARPGTLNEALMELGATVCAPAQLRCDACPLSARCAGRASARAPAIPAPRRAAARRVVHWHALVHADADGLLLVERPAKGLWAGMLQPPTVESGGPVPPDELREAWGTAVRAIASFTHVTSHREVRFVVHAPAAGSSPSVPGGRRVPLDALASQPLSNAAWRAIESAGLPVRTPPSALPGPRRGPRAAPSAPADS